MLADAASQLVGLAKVGGEEDSQQTFLLQLLRRLTPATAEAAEVDLAPDRRRRSATPRRSGWTTPTSSSRRRSGRSWPASSTACCTARPPASTAAGPALDLDALCRAEAPGKTPLNVIYLNALADDDQKHFFVAALAAEVYRWMVTSLDPSRAGPSLLFYLDEARDYIPAGTAKPPAKAPLIRLFTQGRKYGVACLLCTQSPRSVDYNVFGNCSTKLDRPPGERAGPGAGRRVVRHRGPAPPGSRAARGPRPAASSAAGRRCPRPWKGGRSGAAPCSRSTRGPGPPTASRREMADDHS